MTIKRQFAIGCVFMVLLLAAYWLGALRNYNLIDTDTKRPAKDINVHLAPVPIDSRISTNSWIKHYDVYISALPSHSCFLPLLFIPNSGAFHTTIRREDYMELVVGSMVKPFCPEQADIDSGRPFVIYLDYIDRYYTNGTFADAKIQPVY